MKPVLTIDKLLLFFIDTVRIFTCSTEVNSVCAKALTSGQNTCTAQMRRQSKVGWYFSSKIANNFRGFGTVTPCHVGASFVSLAPTYFSKSERAHAAAPPLQIEPAALGFDLVSGTALKPLHLFCSHCPKENATCFDKSHFFWGGAPGGRSTRWHLNARGRQSRPFAILRRYAATNLRRKRAAGQKAGWVLLK